MKVRTACCKPCVELRHCCFAGRHAAHFFEAVKTLMHAHSDMKLLGRNVIKLIQSVSPVGHPAPCQTCRLHCSCVHLRTCGSF